MEKENHLTIHERFILTHIQYRTNNNHKFYAGNESIAEIIGCQISSTKVMVNKLIRLGYLIKTYDAKGRRNLSLSGKDFIPLHGVLMNNIDKNLLKQDAQNQEQWAEYSKQELVVAQSRIKKLEEDLLQARLEIQRLQAELNEKNASITVKNPENIEKTPSKDEVSADIDDDHSVIYGILERFQLSENPTSNFRNSH